MERIYRRLNDRPAARWTVLFIVATAMMMGYFVNDVMSPLETLLEAPPSEGGLGWTPADYGFFSGASGLINVFLLMLFFSGLILDKMGIRFTGRLSCSLMLAGTLLKLFAVTHDFGGARFALLGLELPMSAAMASLGFAVFGVGYEMTGITVSKAMVRWFTGHELAMAMGLQLAMARLGTAAEHIGTHSATLQPLHAAAPGRGTALHRAAGLPGVLRDGPPARQGHGHR